LRSVFLKRYTRNKICFWIKNIFKSSINVVYFLKKGFRIKQWLMGTWEREAIPIPANSSNFAIDTIDFLAVSAL